MSECPSSAPLGRALARATFVLLVLASAGRLLAGGFASGPKLVPADFAGAASVGSAVSISSDGDTLLVGGSSDDNQTGAAWVFVRTAGVWAQLGDKLVGTGAVGPAQQGWSVALSSDGSTAIVGGPADDASTGAAWVFVRTANGFVQQGGKLVGTGRTNSSEQGTSVALSSAGATALIGGAGDGGDLGATWVFTRSAGVWTQQGGKLVGSGAAGPSEQGWAVAVSSIGTTAVVGGPNDAAGLGATWVFTRNLLGVWSQQGGKLVGSGGGDFANQGNGVAVSGDGGTALVGGPTDSTDGGASWVFVRSGTSWTQQAGPLRGNDASLSALQGNSVALSGDGNTALVGGPGDESEQGSIWVFTRTGTAWSQQGKKLTGTGASGQALQGSSTALSSDASTAVSGGIQDGNGIGASWVFMRACTNGDVNGDGLVNVGDVFSLVNFLFAGGAPPHACS